MRKICTKAFFLFLLFLCLSCATATQDSDINNQVDIVLEIANIYHKNGDYALEEQTLKGFIDQNGRINNKINFNLALIYYNNAEYQKAIDICTSEFKRSPEFLDYLRINAKCYEKLEKVNDCIDTYETLIASTNANNDDFKDYIEYLLKINDNENALRVVRIAIDERYLFSKELLSLAPKLDSENREYIILNDNIID